MKHLSMRLRAQEMSRLAYSPVCLALLLASLTHNAIAATELAPVVITAATLESPLRVTTDPTKPRQPLPASDAGDYLLTIPGFSAVRGGGSNSDPTFRGMFGSRLNLLADGVQTLGACPSRMDSPSSYILPQSYDQLTVIKGPQTVLWGPGGSAATVLFEREPLRVAQLTTQARGSSLIGSAGRQEHSLDAALASQEGYIRGLATRSRGDDYRDGAGDEVHSRWNKWSSDLLLGWLPNEDSLLELSVAKSNGEAAYAGRGMDGAQFLRESVALRFEQEHLSEHLHKLEMRLYYNYADHVMDNFSLRTPSMSGMMAGPMATAVDRRTVGARLASHWQLAQWQWVVGVDAQRNEHRKRSSSYNAMLKQYRDADQFAWNKDANFTQLGLFSELTLPLNESERWVAGARVDHWQAQDHRQNVTAKTNTRQDHLPSGFIRYERELNQWPVSFYAGLGHTQRYPDYWELFSPNATEIAGVNAFELILPEKTTQLDVGLTYQQGPWDAWVSAYAGQVRDYILFTYVPGQMGNLSSRASNVDGRIMGAELGSSYQLSEQLKLEGSLAYAWGKNSSNGDPLPQIAPLEGRLGLLYEHQAWQFGALWRVVAAQHRVATGQGNVTSRDFDASAGFAVFSVNAAYRFNQHVALSSGVDNLFNRTYSEHLNQAGNASFGYAANTRINEQGRTLWARLDLSF